MARESDLIEALRRVGRASGTDLARMLAVSPATLSRLVRAAGPAVCRMGKRRGAMYALRRPVRGLPASVPVARVGSDGRIERIGELDPLHDGSHWLHRGEGRGVLYEGTPPFVVDMQPQGFLGAAFARLHPDLELPARLQDWSDDHRLIALAHRGEDCIGNLVLGEASLKRLWRAREQDPTPVPDDAYPDCARTAVDRPAGSSAGGEGPKFLAWSAATQRHVLVKFTAGRGDESDRRWRDLLACEAIALATLAARGIPVPAARVLDRDGRRFLEVARFDREGAHGRIGVVSMHAFDAEYIGIGSGWTRVAEAMRARGAIARADAERIRWLDAFGALIGNVDRHLGNITFFAPDPGAERNPRLALAPVYDMLPMTFAPAEGRIRPAAYAPEPPGADQLDVWPDAADAAAEFWTRVAGDERVSDAFRATARDARYALDRLRERVAPGSTGPAGG